jgi:hypothetical protein
MGKIFSILTGGGNAGGLYSANSLILKILIQTISPQPGTGMPGRQQRRSYSAPHGRQIKKVVSSKESGFFDFCPWSLTLAKIKLCLYYILKTIFYNVD